MTVKIVWKTDQIKRGLDLYEQKIYESLKLVAEYWSPIIETYAKQHASWSDRTGNARQSLHTIVKELSRDTVAIYLTHGVDYGLFLETRWAGRYGILADSLQAHYEPISRMLQRVLK